MRTVSESFFIPAPPLDVYRRWKSRLGLAETARPRPGGLTIVQDEEGSEVQWRSRWGVLRVEGRADFIPAEGGCILYLEYGGAGLLPRLYLAANRPSMAPPRRRTPGRAVPTSAFDAS